MQALRHIKSSRGHRDDQNLTALFSSRPLSALYAPREPSTQTRAAWLRTTRVWGRLEKGSVHAMMMMHSTRPKTHLAKVCFFC